MSGSWCCRSSRRSRRRLPAPPSAPISPRTWSGCSKDLSSAQLEAPGTNGSRHPVRQGQLRRIVAAGVRTFARVRAFFQAALESSAVRIAHAVGTLTEQVLKLRGNAPVLVSLARAGTPVGILMKRWAWEVHGLKLPHYAVSIVRGLGIDQTALGYLAPGTARRTHVRGRLDRQGGHRPRTRRRRRTLRKDRRAAFRPDLAVLADPGALRPDLRHPGGLSRPLGLPELDGLRPRLTHRLQQGADRPRRFPRRQVLLANSPAATSPATSWTAVTAQFPGVRDGSCGSGPRPSDIAGLPDADWSGWAAVEEISRSFGINNVNLVKPGVGETTRVLLRRVPWKVLVRPEACRSSPTCCTWPNSAASRCWRFRTWPTAASD